MSYEIEYALRRIAAALERANELTVLAQNENREINSKFLARQENLIEAQTAIVKIEEENLDLKKSGIASEVRQGGFIKKGASN